jgi:ABC-type phosphate/phosphonate transport system substrate-binding protein
MTSRPIVVGAVAYDPKAVTIWELVRDLYRARPTPLDFVLYSNYEAQVDALFAGHVDIAWNTPVAWVKAKRRSKGAALALAMRDTDQGFTSKLIARAGSGVKGPPDLRGKRVAFGSRDSAQAAILPLEHLRRAGLEAGKDFEALRFDIDVGKHGDTGTSELEVVKALVAREADAGFVGDATWANLVAQGQVDRNAAQAVWTSPPFDHCNFTALPSCPEEKRASFVEGLLAMRYDEPTVRKMMDLEGLKRWMPGRTEHYGVLEEAMERQGMLA